MRHAGVLRSAAVFAVAVLLVVGDVPAAPQAAPSGVSLKRFKDVPVEMATGEWVRRETPDFRLKSRGLPLEIARNYRSRREATGLFGQGWAWNHGEHLEFPGDLVINYVTPDAVVPIYPDVCYTAAYARVCVASPTWEQGGNAVGEPDAMGGYGNVAHFYGAIGTIQPLVVGGWGFEEPSGYSSILQVDLACIGATAFDDDHPQYGLKMKLSAGGTNSVAWGHRAYDIDTVDVTSDRAVWTWADVNALQARLELDSFRQNVEMDVIADTFHVGITYTKNESGEFKYLPGSGFTLIKTNGDYCILNKNGTRLVFAQDGRLLQKADADGNTLSFRYDAAGRPVQIVDALNQAISLQYEDGRADAKVVRVSDRHARSVGYAYEGDDLVAFTNVLGAVTRYRYAVQETEPELRHNLTGVTDADGNGVRVVYHTTNGTPDRVARYYDGEISGGRTNEVDYVYLKGTTYSFMPGAGSLQGVVYGASNDISQVYVREGELADQDSDGFNLVAGHPAGTVTSPQPATWQNIVFATGVTNDLMAHNAMVGTNSFLEASGWGFRVPGMSNGIIRVMLSVRGSTCQRACLSAGGVSSTNWTATNTTSVALDITRDKTVWSWADISNLTARVSLPAGASTAADIWVDGFTLDVRYRHFDPGIDPGDAFYFYDMAHNIVAVRRDGASHQFAYDGRGNLVSWTDPEGNERRYEYDPVWDKPVRSWDALGNVTTMAYDSRGRLVRVTEPDGGTSETAYDRYGNVTRKTDPLGGVEETRYDTNGFNRISTRSPRGVETRFDYDSVGNCTRISDPLGGSRHLRYDAAGRVTDEVDEAGVVSHTEYNAGGQPTQVVAAAGTIEAATAVRRYDACGRVVEVIDPLGNTESADYDGYGRVAARTDALGAVTVTEYDLGDNPSLTFDPMGHWSGALYDGRGNALVLQDKRGFSVVADYDGNNNPVSVTDKGGNRVTFEYDANGNKVRETAVFAGSPDCPAESLPAPLVTSYAYDSANRCTNKTVGVGHEGARTFLTAYDAIGRPVRETDALGRLRVTAYDADGNVTHRALYDADGLCARSESTVYDAGGRAVLEVKGVGGTVVTNRFEYDVRGLKSASIDTLGNRTTFGYDRHRQLTGVTDPTGVSRRIRFDRAGRKSSEATGSGAVTGYTWDAAGRLVGKCVGVGRADARTFTYAHDALGRLVAESDPQGAVTGTAYDEEGNIIAETNKLGAVKRYAHDAMGRVTNVVDELGFATQLRLDGRGCIAAVVDRLGRETRSTYDIHARLTRLVDPRGGVSRYVYDRAGNKIEEVDALGLVTRYAFDAADRVTNKTVGAGLTDACIHTTVYDGLGRVVRLGNPDGSVVSQDYDGEGNLIARTDPRGAVTRFGYDAIHRCISETNAAGGVTRTSYDDRGNVQSLTDALGGVTTYVHDGYDLKRSETDALGAVTRYVYDPMGRVTEVTDALGGREVRTYDRAGNTVAVTEKNGAVSRFVADAQGRVTQATDALGFQTRKTYDACGNMLTSADARGNVTRYRYDELNRVSEIADPASNAVSFAYDAVGNKIREESPSGMVTTYGYDRLGRLVVRTVGAGREEARTTRYAHDRMGRVIRETDPLGFAVETRHDVSGNKTNMVDRRGFGVAIEYDVLGRPVRTTDALGHLSLVEYDALGRIIGTINRRGLRTGHTYDALGRLTSVTDAEGNVTLNRYDRLGRLCEETAANGLQTWLAYDAVGRLTNSIAVAEEEDEEDRVQEFEYDLRGQRTRAVDSVGTSTVSTYDPAGNVVTTAVYSADGQFLRCKTTQFDSLNHAVRETDFRGSVRHYEYDASGRKSAEVDPLGNRTSYAYNVFGELTSVTDALGRRATVSYDRCGRIAGTCDALAQRTDYRYDANGNRIGVINDSGYAVVTAHDALNRPTEVNRSMPALPFDVLRRADVNGDEVIDGEDVAVLEGELP